MCSIIKIYEIVIFPDVFLAKAGIQVFVEILFGTCLFFNFYIKTNYLIIRNT